MKVFTYCRVSSKKQTSGDGLERQGETIGAFCKKHNLSVAVGFSEPISGTVDGLDRPVFSDLLSQVDARAGTSEAIGALVCERMDRIGRDMIVSELLLRECRNRKLKVFCADRGDLVDVASNGADPVIVLIRQVLSAVSEFEKNCTVKKLRAARDRIRNETGRCEGVKPYGFFPGEQDVINSVRMLCQGVSPAPTWQHLANFLNGAGIKTRTGRIWTWDNVRATLGVHTK